MQKTPKPDHLRSYQQERVVGIIAEFRNHLSTLLAVAVGCGKTHIYLAWLREVLKPGQRAMVIAHRRELIYQPVARIEKFFPTLPRPGVVMAEQRDVDSQLVIATVQSLNSGMRLNEILAYGPIDYLVIDEAHHATSDTYENVCRRLREANPDIHILGVTATPRRSDETRLSDVFETAPDALRLSLNDAVAMGALVPFVVQGFYVETVSLDHIPQYKGDWGSKGVGEVMSEKAVLDTAVAKWKEHTPGLQTIAFCATTGQAHKTAQWFRDAGVPAESADYRTHKDERAAMQRRFERGETRILCNWGLWTEGVDWPMAEVALMMRPTQSDSLYIQMAGRVLRTFPGKKRARILDLAPADARDMVMGGDLLAGVPKPQRKAEDKAVELGIMPAFGIDRKGQGIDGDPDKVVMRVLNYLIQSTLAWKKDDFLATIGLSDTKTLCVVFPDAERLANAEAIMDTTRWTDVCQREYDKIKKLRVYAIEQAQRKAPKYVSNLGAFETWDDLIPATEEYAQENQDATLAKRGKRWRNLVPTDGQIKFGQRLGIADAAGMRRGALAQAITHKLALDLLKRKRLA